MGASGPDRAAANPVPPVLPFAGRTAPIPADSIATLLHELSPSELPGLLKVIESSSPSLGEAQSAELLRGAAEALTQGHVERALDVVRHIVRLDPGRAADIPSATELAPIRPEVERVLAQLTATARLHAEGSVADATKRFETGSLNTVLAAPVRPEVVLAAANRLMDAGGLVNYVRAAAVAAALDDPARWVPEAAPVQPQSRPRSFEKPLLIALWVGAGIAGLALCWWLRAEYLPVVCGVWAGILILVLLRRPHLR